MYHKKRSGRLLGLTCQIIATAAVLVTVSCQVLNSEEEHTPKLPDVPPDTLSESKDSLTARDNILIL